uniref:Ionotropic receptor n=1 Tax=Panagrellus redivivus TaxID=6233 RepID=A0A7E4VNW6_PANRE
MLLSSILSPIDTSPFQTTDQMIALLANKKFKMVTFTMQYETLWFFDVLQTSNETFYKNIRDALADNPIVIKDTLEEALELVSQGRYILMTQEDFEGILNIQRTCDLIKFTQGLPTQSAYYIFPRNSSILRLWNRAIVMNYPFIRHTYERYFGANVKLVIPPICPNERFVSDALQPIDFLAFFGTFLLYFLGLICALIALVAEFCINKCHQRAKANPNFMIGTIKEIRNPKIRRWMLRFYSFKQA